MAHDNMLRAKLPCWRVPCVLLCRCHSVPCNLPNGGPQAEASTHALSSDLPVYLLLPCILKQLPPAQSLVLVYILVAASNVAESVCGHCGKAVGVRTLCHRLLIVEQSEARARVRAIGQVVEQGFR